jgi:uncharacterized membrane protein
MSIASMSDARLARTRHPGGRRRPAYPIHAGGPSASDEPTEITPLAAANDVARWIPTEAVALYLAAYAGIFGASTTRGVDFASRWHFFLLVGLPGTSLLVLLIYTTKWRMVANTAYTFPALEIVLADLAFTAWALALPGSPAMQWNAYGDWFPVAVLLTATSLIPLIGGALGMNPPTYVEPEADPSLSAQEAREHAQQARDAAREARGHRDHAETSRRAALDARTHAGRAARSATTHQAAAETARDQARSARADTELAARALAAGVAMHQAANGEPEVVHVPAAH